MAEKCKCGRDFAQRPHGVCYICECEALALAYGVLVTPSQQGPNRERIEQPPAWKPKTVEVTNGSR